MAGDMRFRSALLIVLLVSLAAFSTARAQEPARFALLIGNQSYKPDVGPLTNPQNDVALLERALTSIGFKVTTVKDVGFASLYQAVNAYARRLQAAGPGAVGFLYFSGHGAANEDNGADYLIPVDVSSVDSGELWDSSIRLGDITSKLKTEAGNATHFVVVDACRNKLKLRKAGSKAVMQAKGFRPVQGESGMLIAFATAEGELSSDEGNGAGPYSRVLAEEIVKPNTEAVAVFRHVQVRVRQAIGQEPWLGFNALGEVFLAGLTPPSVSSSSAAPSASEAAQAWAVTQNTTSQAVLEDFIRQFGNTPYGSMARARLDELKKSQVAVVAPPVTPAKPASPCGDTVSVALSSRSPQTLSANEECTLKARDVFKECDKCPEMVVVPAGSFTMGSPPIEAQRSRDEGPQHRVTFSQPFAVGKFSITFDEWDACAADGGCNNYRPDDRGWGRGRQPVINVSWDDAKAYVTWLSRKTGKPYRLLSESEREYVTRAGTSTPFWWGSSISTSQANYDGNSTYGSGAKGEYRQRTVAVDSFQPNPWGLYQVHGNVYDWVEDCYHDTYDEAPSDGSAWTSGYCKSRVLRGGSWGVSPGFLRAAFRDGNTSGFPIFSFFGFRVGRTITP
jgi:formylglycine-generating enzyme required for sulfatase activity